MNKKIISLIVYIILPFFAISAPGKTVAPEFSAAGFFDLKDSGREVYNFNVGWRFTRGDVKGAEKADFDDSAWDVVSTPHTVKLMPSEASGNRNYQGIAWYRKHFTLSPDLQGKLVNVYFEAAMGKSAVYLNGKLVAEHLGGYLPFAIELTELGVKPGDKCVIAVSVDNSDDKSYPPGKTQSTLDFTYHGGIYRDVWLIATSKTHITDPNKAGKVAGGGVFIQFGEISDLKAEIKIGTDITNSSPKTQSVTLENRIVDSNGRVVKTVRSKTTIPAGATKQIDQRTTLENPRLWSPDAPHLYKVESRLTASDGTPLDGGATRIGIRKLEFRGKDGFWLNGRPSQKLIGGNRHQDYAYVGNAVPNSQHWRDAKKLRDAGCRIIRVAHYPQDPSFMDACDELGMFVIVATPGWQFWNKEPRFAELVYDDIRNMIRRDRNHASVLMWEPILNETRFPLEFALEAQRITHSEFPGSACAADNHSAGVAENYEVVYGWPKDVGNFNQPIFTREFGENVDDWYAHNTNNRASRSWGEWPMIVQSLHLAGAYDEMCIKNPQFMGGALWHPFDHQRGYHPDPYWGGILDAFRQPKYSFYMFKSQVSAALEHPTSDTGPMVFIAHEMSPFSPPDVTVFTNCDEVRLIVYETDTLVQQVPRSMHDMPNPPVTFKNVYDFNTARVFSYTEKNWQRVSIVAEGLIGGKVVCSQKKMPSRRSTKLSLHVDNENQRLTADGSDFVTVVCEVTDDSGNVRRLAKEQIFFTVTGEGEIIGDDAIGANPRTVEFGSAPLLVRSTLKPGKIKVHARVVYEGEHAPLPADIEFESIAPTRRFVYTEKPSINNTENYTPSYIRRLNEEEKAKMLDEVERQQTEFGEKKTENQ